MTIARDHTGAVVGQVTTARCYCPGDCNCRHQGSPWNRPNLCGCHQHEHHVQLLTRDGRYVTVPASSVRLETVR